MGPLLGVFLLTCGWFLTGFIVATICLKVVKDEDSMFYTREGFNFFMVVMLPPSVLLEFPAKLLEKYEKPINTIFQKWVNLFVKEK
jgi:hypothetical protein